MQHETADKYSQVVSVLEQQLPTPVMEPSPGSPGHRVTGSPGQQFGDNSTSIDSSCQFG